MSLLSMHASLTPVPPLLCVCLFCRKSSTPKEPAMPAHRGAPTEVNNRKWMAMANTLQAVLALPAPR